MSEELEDPSATPEEVTKNLMLLLEATLKVEYGEFENVEAVHKWLYAKGYKTTERHRIQSLHEAEQLDAESEDIIRRLKHK